MENAASTLRGEERAACDGMAQRCACVVRLAPPALEQADNVAPNVLDV
jgi:hypothetical protein